MTAAQKASSAIELPPLALDTFDIPIIGTSSLIVHAWSEKAKKQMLDKQMKRASGGREAKDPFQDFADSLYWLSEKPAKLTPASIEKAKFGFPAIAFKAAAVDACTSTGAMTKVAARQAFHIDGDMVEIIGPLPEMREDIVRVGMGTADIRFRGEFLRWGANVRVTINTRVISAEQVVNLFNLAGFAVGIGEWRPQRDGQNGRFKVATAAEMKGLKR